MAMAATRVWQSVEETMLKWLERRRGKREAEGRFLGAFEEERCCLINIKEDSAELIGTDFPIQPVKALNPQTSTGADGNLIIVLEPLLPHELDNLYMKLTPGSIEFLAVMPKPQVTIPTVGKWLHEPIECSYDEQSGALTLKLRPQEALLTEEYSGDDDLLSLARRDL